MTVLVVCPLVGMRCSKMVCELLGSGVGKQAFAHSVLITSYIRFQ